jgi:hypothetical protein
MTRSKPLLPFLSKQHPILNPTTPLQDPFIVCISVSLADDVCCAELELGWEVGVAGPLYVFGVVVVALVGAAHYLWLVEVAYFLGGTGAA